MKGMQIRRSAQRELKQFKAGFLSRMKRMQYEDLAIEKLKQSRILEQLEGNAIRRSAQRELKQLKQ